jgi:hypothetical protein
VHAWVDLHPDDSLARFQLLGLALTTGSALAAKFYAQSRDWVVARPYDPALRVGFLSAVRYAPESEQFAEAVRETRAWLVAHPQDRAVRQALTYVAALLPVPSAREEIIFETRLALLDDPADARSRIQLIALVRTVPGYPELPEVVTEALEWLRRESDDVEVRNALLALAADFPESPVSLRIAADTREWLSDHVHHPQAASIDQQLSTLDSEARLLLQRRLHDESQEALTLVSVHAEYCSGADQTGLVSGV